MLTLIRHGQAGSRLAYDELSEMGREQARLLGAWQHGRGISFDAIVTGDLERQKQTACEMIVAMPGTLIQPVLDTRWNEFNLDEVYEGIAPLLSEEAEQFRGEFEQLQRDAADLSSPAHRTWRNCDVTIVRAWIEGRYPFAGESFADLCGRVREAMVTLPREGNIAVVTSATPIGICLGIALETAPKHTMRLAAGYNSSFSQLDLRHAEPRLVSFNNVPHLPGERLFTLR